MEKTGGEEKIWLKGTETKGTDESEGRVVTKTESVKASSPL